MFNNHHYKHIIKNLSRVETEGKFPNLVKSIKKKKIKKERNPPPTAKPASNIIIIGKEFCAFIMK